MQSLHGFLKLKRSVPIYVFCFFFQVPRGSHKFGQISLTSGLKVTFSIMRGPWGIHMIFFGSLLSAFQVGSHGFVDFSVYHSHHVVQNNICVFKHCT